MNAQRPEAQRRSDRVVHESAPSSQLHEERSPGGTSAAVVSLPKPRPPKFRRRRILVLAPREPHPAIGGDRVRIYHIARELARYHELTLLTFCRSERERHAPLNTGDVFTRVHRVVLPTRQRLANALSALPGKEPLQVAYYRSRAFQEAADRLAKDHDIVLAHLIRTAEYAAHLRAVRILEMTDAISMSMQRVARLRAGYFDLRRLIYSIEATRLKPYEQRITDAFHLVTLTSPIDETFLYADRPDLARNVAIIANGVDLPATAPSCAARKQGEIALVANMHTLQNFDAAWFFARHVLPKVRAKFPAARLRIIGPIPRIAAYRLKGLPGVEIEGAVPSIPAALATARVGICPMRIGAGIQNKVLDYFASRLPVVCSPLGLEGIEANENEHVLVADTADEWVTQVLRVLTDDVLAQRLADAGRALADERYHWEQRILPLLHRIEHLFGEDVDEGNLPTAALGEA